MLLTSPTAFLSALASLPPFPHARATARAAFLVAPAADGLAAESACDNRYMQMESAFDAQRALAQHAALACAALADAQRAQLSSWGFRIGAVPLDEIEKAGGSLRCCVAEIF